MSLNVVFTAYIGLFILTILVRRSLAIRLRDADRDLFDEHGASLWPWTVPDEQKGLSFDFWVFTKGVSKVSDLRFRRLVSIYRVLSGLVILYLLVLAHYFLRPS